VGFNKVIMQGNITRDCELRYSTGGSAIAKTAIAVSRKFTSNGEKKEETCFVDVTFFGRSAEVANQYLLKGSSVLIEGRLVHEQWVDNENNKRSKHSIISESMQMLGSKDDGQRSAPEVEYQDAGGNVTGREEYSAGRERASEPKPVPTYETEEIPF